MTVKEFKEIIANISQEHDEKNFYIENQDQCLGELYGFIDINNNQLILSVIF